MDRTNANDFRANLKEWMEAARSEPVKITRKTGEAFVLMNAEAFEKMRLELAQLQGLTKGLMDAAQGRTTIATSASLDEVFERAKARALKQVKKAKKAVG